MYGSKKWHGGHRCERRPIKFHFSVSVQWKQANLDANDGWGKNEKENVCGSDGSLWGNGCRVVAEERVDAESEPGVVGP